MKHLKNYQFFFENIAISPTDRPDEKLAKEEINDTSSELQEYTSLKPKIDIIYNSTKNSIEIEQELKKIFPDNKDKNKFLVDYLRLCRVQSEIEQANKNLFNKENDKKYAQEKSRDPEVSKSAAEQVKKIDSDIKDLQLLLVNKSKELQQLRSDHEKLIDDSRENLKKDEQEIQLKK